MLGARWVAVVRAQGRSRGNAMLRCIGLGTQKGQEHWGLIRRYMLRAGQARRRRKDGYGDESGDAATATGAGNWCETSHSSVEKGVFVAFVRRI